jgi:hypothetical protein
MKFILGCKWFECIESFVTAVIKCTNEVPKQDNEIYDVSSVE